MKGRASQPSKLFRVITTPYRALLKARDFYVNSMINCANMNAPGLQRASQHPGLPRSYSAASSGSYDDEDYRELVRAASARGIGGVDLEAYLAKMRAGKGPRALPPRSASVAMGRIDEEGEEGDYNSIVDIKINKNDLKYPRSKSHAAAF